MYSAFRVGIGGPVGAGKTSLTTHMESLNLRREHESNT